MLVCKITYFLVHFQITEKTEVEDNTLRSSVIAILDFLNSIKELKLIEHETFLNNSTISRGVPLAFINRYLGFLEQDCFF